ncbi:MAG: histidine kinase [Candidatus Binatia bacterium]
MSMRSVSFPRFRGLRRGTALEAFSQTERIIATSRVLLAATTLAVAVVDPKVPSFRPDLGYLALGSYVLFSVLVFILVRGGRVRQERVAAWSVPADIAWIALITLFTERGATPFFLLNTFVISTVSVRWGFTASAPVTVLLAFLYPALILAASQWIDAEAFTFGRAHWFRPVYLLALGYLIGYLGEHERRSKQKLAFMLELVTGFRGDRAPWWALARLMRKTLGYFSAQHGLLIVRDPESGRYFAWDMTRRPGQMRVTLRITEHDPFPFPFTRGTEGLLANVLQPGRGNGTCYDVLTGAMRRTTIPPDLRLPGDGATHALLSAPVLIQRELRGRAVVMRETGRKFTRDDLEFLLLLVAQAAAGFETVRLQAKAEEVAVLEERARIARDLHDGFIQSLAGIDLRIEACKLLLQRDPARVPRELDELHQAVDVGYREVRHYLTALRGAGTPTESQDLCTTLDRLAAEFSIRERLRVHLARPPADPRLPPPMAYEVTQIVREALRNAVRHGRATQAVVKLALSPGHVYVIVRDNGRGFASGTVDADGFLAPAAAPWSIRERANALGAALRVWSQAGRGSEISLSIPAPGVRPAVVEQRSQP